MRFIPRWVRLTLLLVFFIIAVSAVVILVGPQFPPPISYYLKPIAKIVFDYDINSATTTVYQRYRAGGPYLVDGNSQALEKDKPQVDSIYRNSNAEYSLQHGFNLVLEINSGYAENSFGLSQSYGYILQIKMPNGVWKNIDCGLDYPNLTKEQIGSHFQKCRGIVGETKGIWEFYLFEIDY